MLVILSILLIIALLSYSPEDPNFIFSENTKKIKNLLGTRGSYISDVFFQSIGLISILIPFSIFFTGLNIFKEKKFLIIIENLFFIILYSIVGSLFFSVFHKKTFWLTINGNNGFIGNLIEESIFINLIKSNETISYYLLIFIIFFIFLFSIKFNLKSILKNLVSLLSIFKRNKKTLYIDEQEKSIDTDKDKQKETRIQENFFFENKTLSSEKNKFKFKLPL